MNGVSATTDNSYTISTMTRQSIQDCGGLIPELNIVEHFDAVDQRKCLAKRPGHMEGWGWRRRAMNADPRAHSKVRPCRGSAPQGWDADVHICCESGAPGTTAMCEPAVLTIKPKVRTQVINGESKSHRATTSVLINSAQPNYFSQVVAALALALGPLAAGLGKGYSSPAIASLQEKQQFAIHTGNFTNTLTINPQQASWVASLSLLGALFGGMFGGIAMKFGRRKVLLITSIPFSASWLVTVFAKNVEMMFATGFVGGFCCAIVLLVSQVYISEIAVPDIRGCLSAVLKIFAHVGVLISFAVGAYLDWRELAMVIGCAPLVLFISVAYMPETPSYLVLVGKEQEAARSLQWFRGPHADVGKELLTIRNNVLAAHSDRYQNPNRHALITILNPILITCGLMVFQRFSGANAFNFYAVSIFRQTFGGMDPHSAAVAVAFVQLLSSLLSGLLIDTVGRLPLLIASSVFMSMALAGFGSFAYYEHVHRGRGYAVAQYDWIPLLCVLVFTIAFSMGISPISWLLIGELFPLEYRGLGSALATSFSYACAFIGVKTFVDFQEMFGLHGAFWFYSAVSIGGLCFIVCFVPETKGKDLSEMNCRSNRNIN